MFELRAANDAMIANAKMSEYENGLFFLTKHLKKMIIWHYFANRISRRNPLGNPPTLETLDQLEAAQTINAFHDLIALGVRKLIEDRNDSWSFTKLFEQIEKRVNHTNSEELRAKIGSFSSQWKNFKRHGDEQGAHIGKNQSPFSLTTFVNLDKCLLQAVEVLDNFVVGEIPYIIELEEERIDLREYLLTMSTNP